ncbi:formyltransferase family protein [Rhodospira trueperi]|uniref:Formyl transferase n=1 Tax=Rhodospira trueperi TaxID=69960 RepID=A0A1G7F5V2_9PROT|nr:formyltransferase family protein [Rhodospira trueperi]SDE71262.1 Formyl transferase [Rhodospira trueperi]
MTEPPTLLLLTPSEDQVEAAAPLRAARPDAAIVPVCDLAALRAAVQARPGARLVSVCSPVIVPADVLAGLSGPAYNLHPGPPDYPGLFPAVFALYDGATSFGVTLHEMAPEVDSGAIVAANTVDIALDMGRLALEALSWRLALHLLEGMAPALTDLSRPLPVLDLSWSGPARRRADFEALCRLPADVDEAEFRRRLRAVGEGPHHALRLTAFGRWFRLEPEHPDAPVLKGGRTMDGCAPLR